MASDNYLLICTVGRDVQSGKRKISVRNSYTTFKNISAITLMATTIHAISVNILQ
jgi:hypothetical protein